MTRARSALLALTGALSAAALSAAPAGAASPCSAPPAKSTVAYASIAGVPADRTSVDVYRPSAACLGSRPAPVVMWVHGGAYRTGDKANQMRDKIALFSSRRYILVSVNYRLTDGSAHAARYPDHFRDVASAVAWVRSHIGRYHGDGKRIALLGHSAGADIVSNVATNPRWLKERGLRPSALRCAGPLDTEGFDKPRAEPDELAQWAAPLGNATDYLHRTSATLLVQPGIGLRPVITLVRGTPRRQAIEQGYANALRAAKVPVTTIDARGLTHAEVNSRIGAPGDTVMTPPLVAFLTTCLG